MPKPIKVNLPYPSLCEIKPDIKIAQKIAPTYSGGHSELNAILQYTYHFFSFQACDSQTANTLMGIAVAEMEHLQILGKMLVQLGANPIFYDYSKYGEYYSTKSISYSKTLEKMLLDDLSGEMLAVQGYRQLIDSINDEKVTAVLCRIVLDEELHIAVLKDLLKQYMNAPTCF